MPHHRHEHAVLDLLVLGARAIHLGLDLDLDQPDVGLVIERKVYTVYGMAVLSFL